MFKLGTRGNLLRLCWHGDKTLFFLVQCVSKKMTKQYTFISSYKQSTLIFVFHRVIYKTWHVDILPSYLVHGCPNKQFTLIASCTGCPTKLDTRIYFLFILYKGVPQNMTRGYTSSLSYTGCFIKHNTTIHFIFTKDDKLR